ncbi:MAG: hypothetical protein AMXMBFR58_06610 [Phycisphaerae bacterium]
MNDVSSDPRAGAVPAAPGARPLDLLTLAVSGFGDAGATGTVLRDWFEFLGGRPAEVVYIDGGSPPTTGRTLLSLLHRGLIDRLELVNPASWENSFHRCYIQEHESGALARLPYIMFIKPDVLPLRRGHDGWLAEDMARLDDPAVFAVTMTHLIDPPRERRTIAGRAYDVHDFASLNFSLMKRSSFREAMRSQIGAFIDGGFRGEYPPHITCEERYRRALIEWAWQEHCRSHGLVTLARPESREWMILHINKYGRKLLGLRRKMRAMDDVERHFDQPKGLYRPAPRGLSKLGRDLEGLVRRLKGRG